MVRFNGVVVLSVVGDVHVDSYMSMVTSFEDAFRSKVYVYVFIRVSGHVRISKKK